MHAIAFSEGLSDFHTFHNRPSARLLKMLHAKSDMNAPMGSWEKPFALLHWLEPLLNVFPKSETSLGGTGQTGKMGPTLRIFLEQP